MGLLLSAASTMALAAAQKGPPVNVLCSVWLELELMGLAGTAMSAAGCTVVVSAAMLNSSAERIPRLHLTSNWPNF